MKLTIDVIKHEVGPASELRMRDPVPADVTEQIETLNYVIQRCEVSIYQIHLLYGVISILRGVRDALYRADEDKRKTRHQKTKEKEE